MKMKPLEFGGEIDIDSVPEDQRLVALVVCVGTGYPWWNFLSQARQIMYTLEQNGWKRPEEPSEDAAKD